MTSKQRCNNILIGKEVDRIPVFPLVMGYSAKCNNVSYQEFASDYIALGESQLRFCELYNVDAITTCSDAFRLSADLGGELHFPFDKPPHLIAPLIRSEADIDSLKKIDVTRGRTFDRIRGTEYLVKHAKDKFVLGWVDMPFAEACSVCGVAEFMYVLYDSPEQAHRLLHFLTDCVIDFALAQVDVGCDMVGCGDAAASLVSAPFFKEFVLPYEKRVIDAIHKKGGRVKLHICGDTTAIIPLMCQANADLYNIDNLVELKKAKEIYKGEGKAIKGNLNPVRLLTQSENEIAAETRQCLIDCADAKYILSCGCEIPTNAKEENVHAFCNSVL